LKYILNEEPHPALRPRWGNGHVYDSQTLLKTMLSLNIAKQHGDNNPYSGPLAVYMQFYITIPPGKKYKHRLNQPHIFKPDLDNLQKLLLDAITNSHIIKDDCQVCEIHATKSYHPKGSTVFEIIELTDGNKESKNEAVETKKINKLKPNTQEI
jgi:Holliday junction resolvase RusA-like endonuclease